MLNFLQIAAYEREISKLREELLKEIGHLEERKEEAVKAAATCSAEHFQNLQDQFFSESHKIINPPKKRRRNIFKEMVQHFGKYAYFPKCQSIPLNILIEINLYLTWVFIFVRLAEASDCTPSNFTLHENRLHQSEEPGSKLLRLLRISYQ